MNFHIVPVPDNFGSFGYLDILEACVTNLGAFWINLGRFVSMSAKFLNIWCDTQFQGVV